MITATANGGTASYEYSINGGNFQSEATFPDLENGNYIITVQDANGCVATSNAIVAVDEIIASAFLDQDISCNNANDAMISVEIGGGNPPFEYSIDGENFQSASVFTGLAVGMYQVIVVDNVGQIATTNDVIVTNPDVISASTIVNEAVISVTANGGTGSLTYNIDGTNFQTESVFSDLNNGNYTITVMDENGCTTTTTATVAVNTLMIGASILENILCAGDANGSIVAEVAGGTAPLQYSLDGENFQDSDTFTGLSSGTYSIVVMDSEGFTQTSEALILDEPVALTGNTNVVGNTITVAATGGTGNLMYSLNNGLDFGEENVFSDLENSAYDIVVMDELGCTLSLSATVNIITAISPETTGISCFNAADGGVTILGVEGGVPPYEYSLNNGDFQTENTFTNLSADNYNLTVQDANGYSFNLVFILDNPIALEISSIVMDANLTITASGGTGNLEYSIDGGVTFGSQSAFTDLENGTYDIVVMDANGCQETDTAIVNVSGLNDLEIDLFFGIQPNPNQGMFTMSLNQATEKELTIQVVDALGRIVFEQQVTKTSFDFQQNMDLDHVADGVYFLKVTDGMLLGTQQILIVR